MQIKLLVPADQEAVYPLRVMVGVEREVLGLLKEFGEHGLASVLTNEFALADVALARSDFHAVFDGALRADPAC